MSRIAGLLSTLLFTLILAGCNTLTVDISVPDVITQHEPFTYEAEADPDAVGQIAYEWSLDGTVISSLPIDNALIATAGEHTLSVKITDEEGETGEAEVTLEVLPAEILNADFAVNVELLDMEEAPLENVTVTIDGVTVESDAQGIAAFTGLTQTLVLTVSANKEGYIPQSYRFDLASAQEGADIQLTLMERANPVSFNNDTEVTVENSDLNTSVTLPAGAFVNANGDPVTGEITATITPVDTREMGASYLGGGVALTEESEVVQLLSLGMIDFEFTQNGEPVQLAAEASAQIEMDLVTEIGPDGRIYAIGEEIEMWWFDEATGLWVEEGVGEIVASASSPTGMRLIATVEHFTTWNWDYYKQEDRASFFLRCSIEGQALSTNETCVVAVSSPGLTRSMIVPAGGVQAINLPPGITFSVYASSTRGSATYSGQTQFTTLAGNIDVNVNVVETEEPLPISTVSCFVLNGSNQYKVECSGLAVDSSGYRRYLKYDPSSGDSILEIYPGETLTLHVSIQGVLQRKSVSGPLSDNEAVSYSFYETAPTGRIQCYGTLDGANGEYFPCAALVTDNFGKNTVARTGDFSGSPLSAPFIFDPAATTASIRIMNGFNDNLVHLNDFVSPYEGQILSYYDGFEPEIDVYDTNLSENVVLSTSFDISSQNLYSYSCVYQGAAYPCVAGSVHGENWIVREAAPSWMLDKMVVYNLEKAVNDIFVFLDDPQGDSNYELYSESVSVNNETQHFTITLARGEKPPVWD
jgi:hypothetical protein